MKKGLLGKVGSLVGASMLAFPASALAQSGPAPQASEGRLDEVIVTATKRQESTQTIPIAISALTADYLERENVSNIDDIRDRVPSLMSYSFSAGIPYYSIRGIGSTLNRSGLVDGAVGSFLNEVYLGRPFMLNTDLADIERVEVLRGPQGTTFGRNTLGGAMSFFTTRPSDELKYSGALTLGNYSGRDFKGMISGPLSDNWSGKLAITSRKRDGFYRNTTTGNDVEDLDFRSVSAALLWKASDTVEVLLNLDSSRRRGTGDWWVIETEGPLTGRAYADPRVGDGHTDDGFGDIDNKGADLHVNVDLGFATLTSITAYREGDLRARTNSTGKRAATIPDTTQNFNTLSNILFVQDETFAADQTSQELRLTSKEGGKVGWIGGLYYYKENVTHVRRSDSRLVFTPTFGRIGFGGYDSTGKTTSIAGYGNVSFSPTERLNLVAGLRWTRDEKNLTQIAVGTNTFGGRYRINGVNLPAGVGFTAIGSDSWSATTGSFSANFSLSDTKFLYATVSRGTRSGGFNDNQPDQREAETPFKPEFVMNYEVGVKSDWLDQRLRVNVAAFQMDYKDAQTAVAIPGTSPVVFVTGNTGNATIKGFELESQFLPIRNLALALNYTNLDSRLDDWQSQGTDFTGKQLALVPRDKYFASIDYTFELGEFTLVPRASYNYTTPRYTSVANLPSERVPASENLDFSIELANTTKGYAVELWMKNAQDNLNYTGVFDFGGTVYGHLGTPKTYGLTLSYRP